MNQLGTPGGRAFGVRAARRESTPGSKPGADAFRGAPGACERRQLRRMWGAKWMGVLVLLFAVGPSLVLGGTNVRLVVVLSLVPLAMFTLSEFLVERGSDVARAPAVSGRFSRTLLGVLFVAVLIGYCVLVAGGYGSIAEVVEGYAYSPMYTAARMLTSLAPLCLGMVVYSEYFGHISRKRAWVSAITILASAMLASLSAGYLSGFLPEAVTFLVLGTLTGMLGRRTLGAGLIMVLVLIPVAFGIRDDVRESAGVGRSSQIVGPFERFRVDSQISLLDRATPSSWLELPELSLYVRTAVVPRLLDPERPTLGIAQQMNYALGYSNANNVSFGNYGTVFWLFGMGGVVIVAGTLGALFGLGVRSFEHIWGLAVICGVARPAVWPEATFPNYLVGLSQFWILSLVAVSVAYLCDLMTRARPRPATEHPPESPPP